MGDLVERLRPQCPHCGAFRPGYLDDGIVTSFPAPEPSIADRQQAEALRGPGAPPQQAGVTEAERIAVALDYEASVCPCAEDAKVIASCATLVRANFSYDEAERIEAGVAEVQRIVREYADLVRTAHEPSYVLHNLLNALTAALSAQGGNAAR
jgi:hypothetical protein